MTPVLSLPSFTGNRNNIDILLYNWRALWRWRRRPISQRKLRYLAEGSGCRLAVYRTNSSFGVRPCKLHTNYPHNARRRRRQRADLSRGSTKYFAADDHQLIWLTLSVLPNSVRQPTQGRFFISNAQPGRNRVFVLCDVSVSLEVVDYRLIWHTTTDCDISSCSIL